MLLLIVIILHTVVCVIPESISNYVYGMGMSRPVVEQEHIEEGQFQFHCTAEGEYMDLLSWYQETRITGTESKFKLLQMIQHLNTSNKTINIILKKTMEPLDRGTTLYCVQQMVNIDNIPGILTNQNVGIWSDPILLNFTGVFKPPVLAQVTVRPGDNPYYYNSNSTIDFVCSGTDRHDNRRLTWYTRDYHTPTELISSNQYNSENNQNTLTLHLEESYHQKTLICVQEFHKEIFLNQTAIIILRYGELARHEITLKIGKRHDDHVNYTSDQDDDDIYNTNARHDDHANNTNEDSTETFINDESNKSIETRLVIALSAGVVVIVLLALVLFIKRCYRLNTKRIQDEDDYKHIGCASAEGNAVQDLGCTVTGTDNKNTEVIYAALQFSTPSPGKTPNKLKMDSSDNYAVIIPQPPVPKTAFH